MAPPVSERPRLQGMITALLEPFPGRLGLAARLALVCALTTLVAEIYQTPEPALTAYVAFFVIKPDRATSIVVSIVMLVLITLVIGAVMASTTLVIDYALWRVVTMTVLSFCLLFLSSASKLKPIAGIVALITAYALDLLASARGGEIATRALLYAWLFVGIPASISISVNLILGPAPRRLAEQTLAHRLHASAMMLRGADRHARIAFEECLREGTGEIPAWLKLAGAERTSPQQDIAALRQAMNSTAVILSVVEVMMRGPEPMLPEPFRIRIALILDDMAIVLNGGGYPVEIVLESTDDETMLTPFAVATLAELRVALTSFAEPPLPDVDAPVLAPPNTGFFVPDAFTNPAHVQYALKTTTAAMFCYFVYSMLDWSGIHTCLITCYIISLGTTAETIEKLTLRIVGCLAGAAFGIGALVFLMPDVTSIGVLMAIVFLATLAGGWVAAGSPRVSYIGFQIAFAFLLCVVQGSAPGFDMTIARDRVIGILFGNLVVAVIFTLVWPVSVGRRVDPAIAALLRQLAAVAAPRPAHGGRAKRWALAIEAQAALGTIELDMDLTRYEPSAIRPGQDWLDRRRQAVEALMSLQGPLLICADQGEAVLGGVARRLNRLAGRFGRDPDEVPAKAGADDGPGSDTHVIEVLLNKLEDVAAHDQAAAGGYARG